MNPFHLNGWEAILATLIVCATIFLCVASVSGATVQCTRLICEAVDRFNDTVKDVAKNIAGAITTIFSGKTK